MHVRDVMTRDVDVVHPDAPLAEVAARMKGTDDGPLPVYDGEKLVGMLIDGDVAARVTARGKDLRMATVRDAMTEEIGYCFEDQNIQEAAELMRNKKVRRLVVLDRDQHLVGLVSLSDLTAADSDTAMPSEMLTDIAEQASSQNHGTE